MVNTTIIEAIVGIWAICFFIIATIMLGCMAYAMFIDVIHDVKKRKKGE